MQQTEYLYDYFRKVEREPWPRASLLLLSAVLPATLLIGGNPIVFLKGLGSSGAFGAVIVLPAILFYPVLGVWLCVSILDTQVETALDVPGRGRQSGLLAVDGLTFALLLISLAAWAGYASAFFAVTRAISQVIEDNFMREYAQLAVGGLDMVQYDAIDGVVGPVNLCRAAVFAMVLAWPLMALRATRTPADFFARFFVLFLVMLCFVPFCYLLSVVVMAVMA